MVSNNQLLGSGVIRKEDVKIDRSMEYAKRLYHVNCTKGQVVKTKKEQKEFYELGWVESPADLNEEKEEERVQSVNEVKAELTIALERIKELEGKNKKPFSSLKKGEK